SVEGPQSGDDSLMGPTADGAAPMGGAARSGCWKWRAIEMGSSLATSPETEGPMTHMEDLPDRDLLEEFFHGEAPESQDAFRALVVRHGPSVLGICRHVLDGDHDAEDAFQATFLALARRGNSISDPRALPGWLREVAYRIALRARTRASRRRAIERQA